MLSTPASLLDRLRAPNETAAWDRFVELYSPLLYDWSKRLGLQDSDAADLVQDVFLLLWNKLPAFHYDPSRSFHAWLKTLFLNQHRLRLRRHAPQPIDQPWNEVPGKAAESAERFEDEHRRYLIRRAFQLIESEFSAVYRAAFQEYALRQRAPEEVARELGIRPGTVYGIKSKILNRLRQELRDLLD